MSWCSLNILDLKLSLQKLAFPLLLTEIYLTLLSDVHQLLYEIQLYALSPSLPYLSRFFLSTFKETPISFRVQYLIASCTNIFTPLHFAEILSKALRFPLCTIPVLDQFCSRLELLSQSRWSLLIWPEQENHSRVHLCELPRRLFRSLVPRQGEQEWHTSAEPLPFLQHILDKGTSFPPLDPDSHQGYALTRAVYAHHIPLIQLLLQLGASPACKKGIAVKVAIRQRSLKMVKLLVERDYWDKSLISPALAKEKRLVQIAQKGKRRRLGDRVEVDQSMLKLAVECDATDIIEYLAWDKGVIPDMQTLTSIHSWLVNLPKRIAQINS